MDNGITKKGIFNLTVEPYLKPISDIGVGFYNLDENTATLRFNLYNTKGPLLIEENNVDVHAYFESSNGSVSGEIEVDIVDELNGVAELTLDKEFLQASTSTTVKGQLYVGVHNVDNKPEYNEVAVLREFDFEVADALINKISSFTKIEYIRMFDKLKEQIQQRVHDIEEAIANGEDYVAEMKNTLANGKAELNNIVTDGVNNINNIVNQYKQDVLDLKNTTETNVNTLSVDTINQISTKATNATDTVNDSMNNAINHVDDKMTEFNNLVETNGFLTPQDVDNKINNLNWQKYKLTDENGRNITISIGNDLSKLHALLPGNYYATTVPINGATSTSGFMNVLFSGSATVKHIVFKPYNSNQIFLKRLYNEWSDWEIVNVIRNDTSWLPITWLNGAEQSSIVTFESSYRVIESNGVKKVYLRIGAVNIRSNQLFARIPSNVTGGIDHYGIATSTIAKVPPKIKIYSDGSIEMYKHTNDTWENNAYIIFEMNWLI